MYKLLNAWFDGRLDDFLPKYNQVLGDPKTEFCILSAGQQAAMVTQAWKAIFTDDIVRLFVKPDDRWDRNDVSSRCGLVVTQMQELLDSERKWLADHGSYQAQLLPTELTAQL